jgi:hypothetical protein
MELGAQWGYSYGPKQWITTMEHKEHRGRDRLAAGFLLTCAALTGCGGSDPEDEAAAFAGTFVGDLNGTPASIQLQALGSTLAGTFSAGGYAYPLSATVEGSTASGRVQDPAGAGEFTANLAGDTLHWTMAVMVLGQVQPTSYTFQFQRQGAGQGLAAAGGQGGGAAGQVMRDPALVGRWRHTDPTPGVVTDYWLYINRDGTFRLGDMNTPDAGWISDGVLTGQWRSQDQHIYSMATGTSAWQLYARYYIEGNSMLLTYSDGERVIWHRIP